MRPHESDRATRGVAARRVGPRARRITVFAALVPAVAVLSGCSASVQRGWLPTERDTTNQTARIMDLWNGSWIAALLVGALTWGLMLWAAVVYRRRRDDTGLPPQVRYHLPLEIFYTIVPLMMIGVLFFFTARDQAAIADTSTKPDVTVEVIAKRWSWDFNYLGSDVYETGVQAQLDGTSAVEDTVPVLYLPVGERVQFDLYARDVAHSFWVPAFLYKMDTLPGVMNHFQVVPQREGEFQGKCAELCGEYHSEMLFKVKVVSRVEYDAHLQDLRAKGQTGRLGVDLGMSPMPADKSGSTP